MERLKEWESRCESGVYKRKKVVIQCDLGFFAEVFFFVFYRTTLLAHEIKKTGLRITLECAKFTF